MKSSPLVSIIMNCRNGDRFLRQAIDSVYDQTYQNWELIFWDNVSSDSSALIAQSYDNRTKYFLAENKTSLGEARNLALERANGKYVCFLDCDDLYFPDKLEKQVKIMEENNYALSYGSALIIDENNKVIRKFPSRNKSGYIFEALLNHYEINMQSVILLHSYLLNNNLNFLTTMEYCPDHNLFMQIASKNKVGVEPEYIVKYRILENSLSSRTIALAGSEVRLTLDKIAHDQPKIKLELNKQFEQAYAKCDYYDAIAAINSDDFKMARNILKPILRLKYQYFFLFLLLLLPIPSPLVLRFLNR